MKSKFLKNVFAALLFHNINPTAENSSETDSKWPMNQVDRRDPN